MSKPTPAGMRAEVPNDQVASVGREFRKTVDFLYEHIKQVPFPSPFLMLGAFGIEIFLKSLNAQFVYHQDRAFLKELDGYRVTAESLARGHNLVPLFDELETTLQNELEAAYSKQPVVSGKKTIREALAVYDSLFVDARYPFEDGKGEKGKNITELVDLLRLIADHVGSLTKRILVPDPD